MQKAKEGLMVNNAILMYLMGQTSKALQEDNFHTAINNDEQDDTIQFGNPVMQPFLSRSIQVPTTEVGCLRFMQMLQDYLEAYLPPLQADAYSQIQGMAQWLDVYLNKYPAQYINPLTSSYIAVTV